MSYLESFSKSIDQSLSTSDVVTKVIIPGTKEHHCRYVDILDSQCVGPPDFFISHRWGANFQTLLKSVKQHFEEEDSALGKDICVWIDIFAINQHPGREQVDDLAHLQNVIRQAQSTLLILDDTGQVLCLGITDCVPCFVLTFKLYAMASQI
ncbi:hypothetical protein CEUSTIGMA_g6458.t1 [Chlamydomonas eustigma]|uniref:Uncharacterized protein n=1 Tax=Chlamydomonas eustigma TaxID=1157962 RepID=A0A250X7G0_9CHLO|nr:hypothetical protein CEUSTIGMA_g6458.t1 [Chlamydomonas eustigma]|eukprot:GAX79018.1 hypothetical protein CEUSTIGMA_g6458.t1 [Chlamydomonas eustigma]